MIPKSAISFKVTDFPDDPEKLVGTAEQTTRVNWIVGKVGWSPNDYEQLKLSLTRKVWIVLYGDVRTKLINVMNALRNVPDPDYSVTTALSTIEELLAQLNLPHSDEL
jgi:hypothetical protein